MGELRTMKLIAYVVDEKTTDHLGKIFYDSLTDKFDLIPHGHDPFNYDSLVDSKKELDLLRVEIGSHYRRLGITPRYLLA